MYAGLQTRRHTWGTLRVWRFYMKGWYYVQLGPKNYDYLLALSVGDAFSEVERIWGVKVTVQLEQDPADPKSNRLWWYIAIKFRVHQRELNDFGVLAFPYLSPSVCPLDLQISSALCVWCEQVRDHMSREG